MKAKIRSAVLIALSVLLLVSCSACSLFDEATDADTYKLGDDNVPSIKAVVGERKSSGVSKGFEDNKSYFEATYISDTVKEDMVSYHNALYEDYHWSNLTDVDVSQTIGSFQMGTNSVEEGKILLIQLDFDQQGYTVRVQKGPGTITPK